MEEEILDKYKRAGKIAGAARKYGEGLIKEGASVLDVAEKIENKIFSLGGEPAFPVNISIDEVAAHYTPTVDDSLTIENENYVKIDIGVHVDGYIGDTAITVRPAGKDELIKCSERMLSNALRLFTPGRKVSEIGEEIESVAKEFGFNVVSNLTGHGLERWNVHSMPSIPNVSTSKNDVLKEGQVFACEPFCTTGRGFVKDSEPALIFKFIKDSPTRLPEGRKLLFLAKTKYHCLPFAKRWVQRELGKLKTEIAIRDLVSKGSLHPYKILKDSRPVAQTEHTIIVKEKPIVTTII